MDLNEKYAFVSFFCIKSWDFDRESLVRLTTLTRIPLANARTIESEFRQFQSRFESREARHVYTERSSKNFREKKKKKKKKKNRK